MLNDHFPYGIGWVEADGPTAAAEDIHEIFEGVREIDMELAAGKVIFVEGSGDSVHVDTDNLSKKLGFKCYMDDGELKMTSKKKLHNLNGIRGTITVTLPKDRGMAWDRGRIHGDGGGQCTRAVCRGRSRRGDNKQFSGRRSRV